ncbi:MAG: carboxypeptidase-like regulatory domain-containing protein [Bryobacteraceae bacterium]
MRYGLLVLVALMASAFALRADDPDLTKLSFVVTTLGGKPVDRASVVVKFVEGRSIAKFGKKIRTSWQTRTNQEGKVTVPPIPQGKILVQVIAKGYQTFGEMYEVDEEEKTIEVKLNPPQAQYSSHQ